MLLARAPDHSGGHDPRPAVVPAGCLEPQPEMRGWRGSEGDGYMQHFFRPCLGSGVRKPAAASGASRDGLSGRARSSPPTIGYGSGSVAVDHQIMGGPCVRGTRIPVATVVGLAARGLMNAEIRADYPQLADEDIRASPELAAEAVFEGRLPLGIPVWGA